MPAVMPAVMPVPAAAQSMRRRSLGGEAPRGTASAAIALGTPSVVAGAAAEAQSQAAKDRATKLREFQESRKRRQTLAGGIGAADKENPGGSTQKAAKKARSATPSRALSSARNLR